MALTHLIGDLAMPVETNRGTSSSSIRRRSVVKGTAWAAPAIAVAAVAPNASASPVPERGLNGYVQVGRRCTILGEDRFNVDGRGTYNDRGLWTFTDEDDIPVSAQITFWFNRELTFTNGVSTDWTNLTRVPSLDSTTRGYAYTTTYSGDWTYRARGTQNARWEADTDPYWYATGGGCAGRICGYARRSVTYNDGTSVSFDRGPVCV